MSLPNAGVLNVRVRFHGRTIEVIELVLERPVQILAGLHGKHPADCLRLLPRLFPLCGTAHALAALQAVEAAAAMAPGEAHAAARVTLAQADKLAAQVWRNCIDWPQLAGMPDAPAPVAQARRLVERIALGLYPDGDWQRIGGGRLAPAILALADLRDELRQLHASVDLAAESRALRTRMALALSGTDPQWPARVDHCFAEMTEAMLASFHALDGQLQRMPALGATGASSFELPNGFGRGRGVAATARGELVYEIELESARVSACGMSAPTDRAFGPQGPVAQMLARIKHADDPVQAVRWVIAAQDPCIEVRVERAGD